MTNDILRALCTCPGGARAQLVPGSRPPVYTVNGAFLSDGSVGIFIGTYNIPGVFEQARIHMRLRADQPQVVQLQLFEVPA